MVRFVRNLEELEESTAVESSEGVWSTSCEILG